jgi:hypothetical protein
MALVLAKVTTSEEAEPRAKAPRLQIEPQAVKKLTAISPKYVKGWTVSKAVREIVQNYLDSRKEFNCSGSISWDEGVAKVKDFGPGLELKHLAVGVSEKSEGSIGKYGEGLKLALLVLAREGREVTVKARGKVIRPKIEMDLTLGTEVLAFSIKDMLPRHAAKHKGTTILFQCSEAELEEGKSHFTEFLTRQTVSDSSEDTGDEPSRKAIEWVEKGKISLPGGRIFVNGSNVGKVEGALFSYHFQESEVGDIGNRDREVIDRNVVENAVSRMLAQTSSRKVIGLVLKMAVQQTSNFEVRTGVDYSYIPETSKRVWHRVFNELYGKDTVIASGYDQEAINQANYLGYLVKVLTPDWFWVLESVGVKTVRKLIKPGSSKPRIVKPSQLTLQERDNLRRAKRLTKRHYAEPGLIRIAEDIDKLVGMSSGSRALGGYDSATKTVWLRRDILGDFRQVLHTLLHEVCHRESGASDCTASFERALLDIAVGILTK